MAKMKKRKPGKKKAIKRKPAKKSPVKKKILRKAKAKKKAAPKKGTAKKPAKLKIQGLVGTVTHYFPHVQAAVIKLKAPLSVGDTIKIKGHTTDFTHGITSMQIDRVDITNAKPGQEIGLLVKSRVRQHDVVTKG